jgi:hypothetical protein
MVDIQTVSIAIASAGVFAAAVYYILQIRHQTKIRQTDLIMRLYSTRTSKEFQESWAKVMSMESKDYRNYEKWHEWSDFIIVAAFFEGIGILLHRKLVDIALVDDLFSYSIKTIWERIKEVVEEVRKHHNAPQIWEWFEYLYNELKKREQQPASKKA